MSSEVEKNPKQFQLNPNWTQLQQVLSFISKKTIFFKRFLLNFSLVHFLQKLKPSVKPSRFSKNPQSEIPNSVFGKMTSNFAIFVYFNCFKEQETNEF